MSSTRLPGKVLRDLAGLPVLGWCVRAAQAIPGIDAVAVATSADAGDDRIAAWCGENKIICIRGPLHDVLARYALAARQLEAQAVMRLTADCPLLDPQVCGEVLQLFKQSHADYASNVAKDRSWPNGLDCEVFTADALYRAETEATLPYDREHVVPYLLDHPHFFRIESLACPLPGLGFERWTLDYPQDFAFLAEVAKHLPVGRSPSYLEVLLVLEGNPQLRNRDPIVQPAGAVPAARKETPSFAASQALLEKAERLIPQGSQTFSKSARQFPAGHAPLFLTHGEGGRVWDIDGNEYVDLVCGLLPVMLGYADPDVNDAIRRQLNNGITFSLATPLETTLAERMAELVPCAEKIRFAKNGSDATSAAIRLARAYTNRDRAMVCGYHGWQDWYIGSTSRSKGVPAAVRALSHPVPYNDLAAVEALLLKHKGEFAALIMEPVNTTLPQPGFLQDLKDLLHKHGTLLVFDEVITGFRLAKGGAQEYFGVTPDLAAFGKALGNGMPISAIAGRANIMDEMEDIFFSGTFGGETLSLAAAIAVLDKIKREPVIETLWSTGERLRNGVDGLLKQYGLEDVLIQRGLAPWVILDFQPHPKATKEAIKTLFIIEMAKQGVLIAGSHNVCYAHNEADVARALSAYGVVLQKVAEELATGALEKRLPCAPLRPAFTVR
ncbi:MAG: aminotransferase class III-fold pyridoxal phosphate-dependent enzyme [Pseudomonadota bacterium]|nr:aminotransferase class III-fold pyridoxal phosphate-dependent enzyme [Pseudomonadota bacterium]MDE3038081.1 aminotransferase class III-fold pyridoxal phosphate-dependent enzyme [Pseudomonadota bacterium]